MKITSRVLLMAACLAAVTACGAGGSSAPGRKTPGLRRSLTASGVTVAFNKECSAFDHTISAVQTANDVNVGELMATMTVHSNVEAAWNKQLGSASKEPDVLAVPTGNNQARSLASKIGWVAVA